MPDVSTVARWDHYPFEALVRSQKNTKGDAAEVTLAPICTGSSTHDCGSNGTLAIPFNTRSYVSSSYDGRCDDTPFGSGNYECVDYEAGKVTLSGKTLSFVVDLSGDGCGCNAALYLVSMPQSHDASSCHDRYCDANDVCGVRCTELDLMEANTVAWVSTVHVADDGDGEGFGYAHYVSKPEHRLVSPTHDCAYGPSVDCAINTRLPFVAAISFTDRDEPFGYVVDLSQGVHRASLGPVRYVHKPGKGAMRTAEEANAALRASLDAGMTIVVSHWAGPRKDSMGWLDSPCKPDEIAGWSCTDAFVERERWPWLCDVIDGDAPTCSTFTLNELSVRATPAAAPAAAPHAVGGLVAGGIVLTTKELMVNVMIGVSFGLLIGLAIGYLLGSFSSRRAATHSQLDKEDAQMALAASNEEA